MKLLIVALLWPFCSVGASGVRRHQSSSGDVESTTLGKQTMESVIAEAASSERNLARATSPPTPTCGPQVSGMLTYFGGPVLNNVEVTPLFWGNVAFQADIVTFYKEITKSTQIDWLSEYCTPTKGTIGRGKGNNAIVISSSILPSQQALTLVDVYNVMIKLFQKKIISPNKNSYYPIHFGPGYTISGGGIVTCQNACGGHTTINYNSQTAIYYGIIPDMATCACSFGKDPLQTTTQHASHELIEAITNPNVVNRAWVVAATGGEIAELCTENLANFIDSSGRPWVVQKAWSNARGACYSP